MQRSRPRAEGRSDCCPAASAPPAGRYVAVSYAAVLWHQARRSRGRKTGRQTSQRQQQRQQQACSAAHRRRTLRRQSGASTSWPLRRGLVRGGIVVSSQAKRSRGRKAGRQISQRQQRLRITVGCGSYAIDGAVCKADLCIDRGCGAANPSVIVLAYSCHSGDSTAEPSGQQVLVLPTFSSRSHNQVSLYGM